MAGFEKEGKKVVPEDLPEQKQVPGGTAGPVGKAGAVGGVKTEVFGEEHITKCLVYEVVEEACRNFDVKPASLLSWGIGPKEVRLVLGDGRKVIYQKTIG